MCHRKQQTTAHNSGTEQDARGQALIDKELAVIQCETFKPFSFNFIAYGCSLKMLEQHFVFLKRVHILHVEAHISCFRWT